MSSARLLRDVEAKMLSEGFAYYPSANSTNDNDNIPSDGNQEFESSLGPIQSRTYPSVDVAYEALDKYSRSAGFTVSKVNTTFKQQTESQKLANETKVIVRQYFNCTCHVIDKEDGVALIGSKRKNVQKNEDSRKNDCKFKCCAALTSSGDYVFRELRNHHNHPRQDIRGCNVTKKLSIEHLNIIKAYHAEGMTAQEICGNMVDQHHIQVSVRKIYRVIAATNKKAKGDSSIGMELGSIHDIARDHAFSSHDHCDSSDYEINE